jgi:hypothetical protein
MHCIFSVPENTINSLCISYGHRLHDDGFEGLVVSIASDLGDFIYDVHTTNNLAKDWVIALRLLVEPIKEVVVHSIDEKLRATRIGGPRVGHGQSPRLIRNALGEFVGNVTFPVAGV